MPKVVIRYMTRDQSNHEYFHEVVAVSTNREVQC